MEKEQLKKEEQLYKEAQKEGFLHTLEIGRDALFTLISNVQRLEQAIQTIDKEIDSTEPPTPVSTAPLVSQMQLPKMEMRTFDGTLTAWPVFWDWFRIAVHDQPIPPLNKLTYLRGCLLGAAASVIEPYALRTQNYEVVLAALKKRYERPAAIKQALYRELERLPRAKEGNLRTTIEAIDRIIELLGFQGKDVDSTHIIYLIKQKLPKSILEKIEYEKSEWKVPTLRDRLATFVIAEENVASILGYASKESYSPHWDTMEIRCSFCTKPHRTHECRKFSTPDERSKRVVELKLCFLCLKEGHRSKDCKASQCFKCGRRHHPALCSPANNTDNKVTKNTPVNQTTIHLATTETNATFANIRTSPNNLTPLWCIEGFASNPRNHHNSKKVMVLLDTGSERSYITKNLAQTLKMTDSQHETLSVGPFAATKPITMETRRLQVVLESQDRQTKEVVTVNTVPSILHRPLQYAKIKMNVRQRHDIQTALQEPELLLGADVISRIL
ncbi:unnamed protein product, partial [Wuchereria bancrofti]